MLGFFDGLRGSSEAKQNARQIKELRSLVRAKRYAEALRTGTKYLQNVPENPDVQFIVGSIHYMQGRHKKAIACFENALKIGSYDVDVLLLKANSHYVLGQNRLAARCCDRILEVDPKNRSVAELRSKLGSR